MRLHPLRIALATAAFLVSAVALFAFLAAPQLGSAHQRLILGLVKPFGCL